jgi:hypothetical protein
MWIGRPFRASGNLARWERREADGIALVAAEQDDVAVFGAGKEADMPLRAAGMSAPEDDDAARLRLGKRAAPFEEFARSQRPWAGDAGPLQHGAGKGCAPGDAVVGDLGMASVAVVGEYAGVVGRAVAFADTEFAARERQPRRILRRRVLCIGHEWVFQTVARAAVPRPASVLSWTTRT